MPGRTQKALENVCQTRGGRALSKNGLECQPGEEPPFKLAMNSKKSAQAGCLVSAEALLGGVDRMSAFEVCTLMTPLHNHRIGFHHVRSETGIGPIVFRLKEAFDLSPIPVSSLSQASQVVRPPTKAQSLSHR